MFKAFWVGHSQSGCCPVTGSSGMIVRLPRFSALVLAPQSSGLMVQHPGQRLHTLWAAGSETSRLICAVYLKCFFSSACSCQLVSYFRSEKCVVQKPFNGPCKLDYFIFPRFSHDCFVSFFISTWRPICACACKILTIYRKVHIKVALRGLFVALP